MVGLSSNKRSGNVLVGVETQMVPDPSGTQVCMGNSRLFPELRGRWQNRKILSLPHPIGATTTSMQLILKMT